MNNAHKTVVFIVNGMLSGGRLVKYAHLEYRQYQEAYREVIKRFGRERIDVYFALTDECGDNGTFSRLWSLSPVAGKDGRLLLDPVTPPTDFTPSLVINKVKDQLYGHPMYDALLQKNIPVLNVRTVAKLGDKEYSLKMLGDFMPPTGNLIEKTAASRRATIEKFIQAHGTTVLKPHRSNGGRGLVKVESIKNPAVEAIVNDASPYVMQAYVETAGGITGLVNGRHDVRLYVIGGQVVAASIRKPKDGSWLSNTARGGTIEFVAREQIPSDLLSFADAVIKKSNLGPLSFVSFDFFSADSRWYLIEANDQPGTPASFQDEAVASSIQDALVIMCREAIQ